MRTKKSISLNLGEGARKSWKAFFLTGQLLAAKIEIALHEADLIAMPEYDALYTLHKGSPCGMTIKELCSSLAMSHSGLSRMLDRLETRGMIKRVEFPEDKRAVRVKLLPAGAAAMDACWDASSAVVQEHFGGVLNEKEHAQLLRLIAKIAEPLIADKEARSKYPFLHKIER